MSLSLPPPKFQEGGRSSSVTDFFHQLTIKSQKRTAMTVVQTANDEDMVLPYDFIATAAPPKKSKPGTFADFFRGWGNSRISNKARYKASRIIKPPSHLSKARPQMKSFDIDEALLERVMGKPKDAKQASENFLLQQTIRARSRSRIGDAGSMDETQRAGTRGRSRGKPLTTEEAQCMFVGAPYFNVGRTKNGYKPQVVFVDERSKVYSIRSTDHTPLSHISFEASTLATEKIKRDAKSVLTNSRSALHEIPSMLSANGVEPGTTSFQHFLELGVADRATYTMDVPRFENRKLLYLNPEKVGLREMNINAHIERLANLGEIHAAQRDHDYIVSSTNDDTVSDLGTELFAKFLSPLLPEMEGNISLKVQIIALQNVLALKELWHDFSQPDARLRVGQLLWSASGKGGSHVEKDLEPSEREVALLQITLASELLIRLAIVQAVSSARGRVPAFLNEADRNAIESQRSAKVNWDLVLAERFLENVEVSARTPSKTNFHGFFSAISYLASKDEVEPLYQPKNQGKQSAGLLHFAEKLKWPTAGSLEKDVVAKLMRSPEEQAASVPQDDESVYATPLQSPWSGWTGDADYMAAGDKAQRFLGIRRLSHPSNIKSDAGSFRGFARKETAQNMQLYRSVDAEKSGHVGGWLSRSWFSGLILPGDVTNHLLMGTLLETTPDALETLGDIANLRSGFVYSGRSYWSSSSVVGRVMAATKDACECMGWISVPGRPVGHPDGWIDLAIQDVPYDNASMIRIAQSENVGKDSDPMGSEDRMAVQDTDFSSPHDGPCVMGNEVRSEGLAFADSQFAGEASIASMTFSSPVNSKLATLTVPLTYDVIFVSAYPCHPEQSRKAQPKRLQGTPDSHGACLPSDFLAVETSPKSRVPNSAKAEPTSPCHALHVDHRFETIPVATLLSAPSDQRPRALSTPDTRSTDVQNTPEGVVILDCRGTEDLQLLARAWCAKVGENALVAKVGRTCVACSVREAKALEISVIIRI